MSNNHDLLALDWVKSEIEETLNQAKNSLEEYIKNEEDLTKIRFCLTYLHQVYGTLQMVGFHGATLLAEEMEKLCQGLLNNSVPKNEECIEILLQGILQLPDYLEKIKETQKDIPTLILPLLNDLRATRGESLLSGTALFNPDLGAGFNSANNKQHEVHPSEDINNILRKIRLSYQKSLVGLIRNQNLSANLGAIAKLFTKLENISVDKSVSQLWWTAGALAEGLANGGIKNGVSVQLLLGMVDRYIKSIVESNGEALNNKAPEELLKNLLYYVGRSDVESSRVKEVKEAYQLDMAFEIASGVVTSDREAIALAATAIIDELEVIKGSLDLYMNEKDRDPGVLKKMIPALKKLSDTLAIMGMGNQRKLMQDQMNTLEWCIENSTDESLSMKLLDVAGFLLYLEASLTAFSDVDEEGFKELSGYGMVVSPEQLNDAQNAVIRESREGLENIKDSIVNYMVSQWDKDCLEGIPEKIAAVKGGLLMVPLERPAAILEQSASFIRDKFIDSNEKPSWDEMDTIADAISGVEYYLECLSEDNHADESVLSIAAESMAKLDYKVEGEESVVEVEESVTEEIIEDQLKNEISDETTLDLPEEIEEIEKSIEDSINLDVELEVKDLGITDVAANEILDEESSEIEPENKTEIIESEELSEESFISESVAESVSQESADEEDFIDDDIIEIFVEEAGEVLDTINEMLPRWEENWEDEDARAETRRAFHTLKGSGRMVGALDAGELAWSVENMLNKVLDDVIHPSHEMFILIRQVVKQIPALVKAFEEREKPSIDLTLLMETANVFAEGNIPDPDTMENLEKTDVDEQYEEVIEVPELTDVISAEAEAETEIELEVKTEVEEEQEKIITEPEIETEFGFEVEPDTENVQVEIEAEINVEESFDKILADAINLDEEIEDEEKLLSEIDQAVASAIEDQSVSDEMPVLDAGVNQNAPQNEEVTSLNINEVSADSLSVDHEVGEVDIVLTEAISFEIDNEVNEEDLLSDLESSVSEATAQNELLPEKTADVNEDLEQEFLDVIDENLEKQEENLEDLSIADGEKADSDVDAELLEVFTAETTSHLTGIRNFLNKVNDNQGDIHLSDKVIRELHTIKGSARMAGIEQVAQFASPTEKLAKEISALNIPVEQDVLELLNSCAHNIDLSIASLLGNKSGLKPDISGFMKNLEEISGKYLGSVDLLEEDQKPSDQVLSVIVNQNINEIFNANEFLLKWQDKEINLEEVESFIKELEALREVSGKAGLDYMQNLCVQLDETYKFILRNKVGPNEELFKDLLSAHDKLVGMVDNLAAGQSIITAEDDIQKLKLYLDKAALTLDSAEDQSKGQPSAEELDESSEVDLNLNIEEADEMASVKLVPERDQEIVEIFIEEALEVLDESSVILDKWMAEPDNLEDVSVLQRQLHTLKGGARMAEIQEIGDLAHYLENLYESFTQDKLHASDVLFDILQRCHDGLAERVDSIKNTGVCDDADSLIEEIKNYEKQAGEVVAVEHVRALDEEDQKKFIFDKIELENELKNNKADKEILELFLEESDELIESIDTSIESWKEDQSNVESQDQIKRDLHTLKGGARLSELKVLGNASHEFETFLIEAERNKTSFDNTFFNEIESRHDLISQIQDFIKNALSEGVVSSENLEEVEAKVDNAPEEKKLSDIVDDASNEDQLDLNKVLEGSAINQKADIDTEAIVAANKDFLKMQQAQEESNKVAAKKSGPQEMMRVSADLLENMINLAGETSISRARVEKEVTDFSYVLEEMGMTIFRVQELLRRLNQETEEQILSRHEVSGGDTYADFDPLEMDRYSQLHQLSRSMSESSVDMLELRDSMVNKIRDLETILLQQSRINSELQEGLMSSRLVPLSRLAPRLRRIVRQIGGELKKPAELEIINAEGELDRVVLERMVSPLEHMLRNAVDHGIEDPELRKENGKPETGKVTLALSREGADVVLTLSDDGGGIDVEKIKAKAIEKGLMQEGSELTDSEILQFIFSAGFSTATKVTQISGRGVGMDVVYSEIKQLGGTVSINSEINVGSTFVIRLPFTVSVNRALMVQVGEKSYAIPLSHIEGIVRVSPYELESYYDPENENSFTYAGQDYSLRYLGSMVLDSPAPRSIESEKPLPVLLIRGAEHSMAIHVDHVLGSREIVVKSVGVQLSTVNGISGATILGNGSVVIILDIASMIRLEFAESHLVAEIEKEAEPVVEIKSEPTIMVVDDSVTVRKVTSRVLERNGYKVLLAKDGVDAITQLQEHTPDLMLLDIEMPRMDGFEVATQVRHDERLKDMPIIMITSRTGQKHRDRAMSIGVNEYLGKPFQEAGLLEAIQQFIKRNTLNG